MYFSIETSKIKRLGPLLLLIILLPFNNCDYTDTSVFNADQNSGSSYAVSISLSQSSPLRVPVDWQIFTIQGVCDSGLYPSNEVYWTIHNMSGQGILDSYMAGALSFIAACAGDRFAINVLVPCPGAVNTGSNCYGLTQSYRLKVHIQGLTAEGAAPMDARASSQELIISP